MAKSGFCSTCGRTVYLAQDSEEQCPVCSSPIAPTPDLSTQTALRVGENESLFRDINEHIKDLSNVGAHGDAEFLCECGDTACQAPLIIDIESYEEVRRHPERFIVSKGHEIEGVETVVEERLGYSVVEKLGPGRMVAAERHPRS